MDERDIFDSDDMWDYHMKNNPALSFTLFDVLQNFARKVFGEFVDRDDRYFKLKYNQFEWVRITMENIRRNLGFVNGLIYWMWNECWPASAGWAIVDYYCLPKASFYSFKRCAGELIVSIGKSSEYDVYLCNDGLAARYLTFELSYIEKGQVVHIVKQQTHVEMQTSKKVYGFPLNDLPKDAMLICDISSEIGHDRAFYMEGTLPMVKCAAPNIVEQDESSITLSAAVYTHAVELEGEFIFDDNYFSLLPGEKRTVCFRPLENAKSSELTVAGYTVKG